MGLIIGGRLSVVDVSGEVCCDNELDLELLGGRVVVDCGLFGE